MKRIAFGFACLIWLALTWAVHAQEAAIVVPSCGSNPAPPYPVGQVRTVAMDVNGNLCTVGGTGGGVAGVGNAGFPIGATPVTNSSTGSTGAVTASLGGVAGKVTYICSFSVSSFNSTTASADIAVTVATLIGGNTYTYQTTHPAGTAVQAFSQSFNPCLPASAAGASIAVSSAADANATAVDVNVAGFQQ